MRLKISGVANEQCRVYIMKSNEEIAYIDITNGLPGYAVVYEALDASPVHVIARSLITGEVIAHGGVTPEVTTDELSAMTNISWTSIWEGYPFDVRDVCESLNVGPYNTIEEAYNDPGTPELIAADQAAMDKIIYYNDFLVAASLNENAIYAFMGNDVARKVLCDEANQSIANNLYNTCDASAKFTKDTTGYRYASTSSGYVGLPHLTFVTQLWVDNAGSWNVSIGNRYPGSVTTWAKKCTRASTCTGRWVGYHGIYFSQYGGCKIWYTYFARV